MYANYLFLSRFIATVWDRQVIEGLPGFFALFFCMFGLAFVCSVIFLSFFSGCSSGFEYFPLYEWDGILRFYLFRYQRSVLLLYGILVCLLSSTA